LTLALLLIVQQGWAEKFIFTTAWTAQSQFAGYYVAKEIGFYEEVGLDVVIQHPSLNASALQRLQTDQCHAAIFSMLSAIDFISQDMPLVNIFQESMNSSNILISRNGVPPMQLKGKKIGIFNSDPSYLLFILNKTKDMNFRLVPFASGINVFLSGAVDATMATPRNPASGATSLPLFTTVPSTTSPVIAIRSGEHPFTSRTTPSVLSAHAAALTCRSEICAIR